MARTARHRVICSARDYKPNHVVESTREIKLSHGTAVGMVDHSDRLKLEFSDITPEMADLLLKTALNYRNQKTLPFG